VNILERQMVSGQTLTAAPTLDKNVSIVKVLITVIGAMVDLEIKAFPSRTVVTNSPT
jgi:hypothetical protein